MSDLPRKVGLSEAASWLSTLADAIEAGTDLSPLLAEFHDTALLVSDGVARRIMRFDILETAIENAKKNEKSWRFLRQSLEFVQEGLLDATKDIVAANPDVPFKSHLGCFKVIKNPPKLLLELSHFDRTFKHVVSFQDIERYGMDPEHYTITEAVATLNTDVIKQDLIKGKEVPYAKLDRGTHLRIKKET